MRKKQKLMTTFMHLTETLKTVALVKIPGCILFTCFKNGIDKQNLYYFLRSLTGNRST